MRANHFIFIIFLCISIHAFSQQKVYPGKYVIYFKDKSGSEFSISQPEKFLSDRAIKRREKFSIPIDERDLPVSRIYLAELEKLGVKIIEFSKWFNCAIIGSDSDSILQLVSKLGFVLSEIPETLLPEANTSEPEKEYNNSFTYLKIPQAFYKNTFDYGRSQNQIEQLNGQTLHNSGYQGQGVIIAILDAGFYKANELAAFDSAYIQKRVLGVYDFVDQDTIVYDKGEHGMQVWSTIGAYLPGQFVGTAPKASFYLLRSEDAVSENRIEEYNWACAAEFADSVGADVINSSLGYNNFDDKTLSYTYKDMDGKTAISSIAANIAASKGILVVNSAGNEGNDDWKYITAPADAENIITVGAIDASSRYVYFSSVGPTADGRLKPDVAAKGLYATVLSGSGNVSSSNGTSFSSPIMAGMVACLRQAHPNARIPEMIVAIKESANMSSKPDTLLGYGIPDFGLADLLLFAKEEAKYIKDRIIRIFPNPFQSAMNLEIYFPGLTSFELSVYNLWGKLVLKKKLDMNQQNYSNFYITETADWNNGFYVFQITTGDFFFQRKIMKM